MEAPERPCVGSGFCCKQAPCSYGKPVPGGRQCAYLELWEQTETVAPRYRCGKYEEIAASPGSDFSPAFGAGCSSTLFNQERDAILFELRRK